MRTFSIDKTNVYIIHSQQSYKKSFLQANIGPDIRYLTKPEPFCNDFKALLTKKKRPSAAGSIRWKTPSMGPWVPPPFGTPLLHARYGRMLPLWVKHYHQTNRAAASAKPGNTVKSWWICWKGWPAGDQLVKSEWAACLKKNAKKTLTSWNLYRIFCMIRGSVSKLVTLKSPFVVLLNSIIFKKEHSQPLTSDTALTPELCLRSMVQSFIGPC